MQIPAPLTENGGDTLEVLPCPLWHFPPRRSKGATANRSRYVFKTVGSQRDSGKS